MLTLSTISPISFARNPVMIGFTAADANGNAYRATGAGAALVTDIPNLTQGATITINWTAPDQTTHSVLFTVNNDLTNENDIPDNLIGIVGRMRNHARIAPYFFVVHDVRDNKPMLLVESKDTSAGFLVTISFSIVVQGIEYCYTETWLPVPSTLPTDYKIQVIINFEERFYAGSWQAVKTFEFELEDDGTAKPIDISSILANECERTITENPFALYSDSSPRISDNLRRWNIQYREVLPTQTVNWTTSDTFLVMNGGIPQRLFLEENANFFSSRNANNSILTYRNNVQKVIRGERAYLSWYNYSGATKNVKLEVSYLDEFSINNIVVYRYFYEVSTRFCVTFPVSPQALNVPTHVIYYSIRVVDDANTPLSTSPQIYVVDTHYYRSVRSVGYLNAFGLPETKLCTGDFSKTVDTERVLSTGVRYDSYGRAVLVSKQRRAPYQIAWTYRFGGLTGLENEQLTELQLSSVLFDLTGSLQLALTFKTAKASLKGMTDTGETLFDQSIEAEPRIDLLNFAPDSSLFSSVILQNVMQVTGATGSGVYTPTNPTNSGGGGNGGTTVIELGNVTDTDLMLFAQVSSSGQITGFASYPAGKMMRQTRGVDINSPSHLDGIGLKDDQGNVKKITLKEFADDDQAKVALNQGDVYLTNDDTNYPQGPDTFKRIK